MAGKKRLMKRKFVNLAIFTPKVRTGEDISDATMRRLYQKFKRFGFRETPWQYVFDGQLGGIVLPYDSGENEIHVRFYCERIFAEFEIGRSYPTHFIGPRWNANSRLLKILSGEFEKKDLQYLSEMMSSERYREDEAKMLEWSGQDCFAQLRELQARGNFGVFYDFIKNIGWRSLATTIGVVVILAFSFHPTVVVVVGLSILATWVASPTKGQP